ncbi:MAG: DUF2130 domain-containing protein [Erysipelotrichales bacterium]|nr:DUF2130 domain-containing protein [Erysipelotrichales bacterium]
MKKIQTKIENQNTLVLLEDAKKGDLIDLTTLQELNYDHIQKLIDDGKEKVFQERFSALEQKLKAESEKLLSNQLNQSKGQYDKLLSELELNKKSNETELIRKENDIEKKFSAQIATYKQEIEVLKSSSEKEIKLKEKDLESRFQNQIYQLKEQINNLNNEKANAIKQITTETEASIKVLQSRSEVEFQNLKNEYETKLREKDQKINELNFQKSIKNVKQTGEDLEAWCDGEISTYMQNGLLNCIWEKDNLVVKFDGDAKGSKADFLFKIFASDQKTELLTSVCLEMKDENPDTVNKKKNEDFYNQLDKNRLKKGAKYALLVSNLELDKPNIAPIFKVPNYSDMYVVRPAYMMTFLNMLVSLTTRFKDLLLNIEQEKIALIDTLELLEEFDKLKNSYLEKPLESLVKEIESLRKTAVSIKKAANDIDESCDKITERYIREINNKLDRFNIRKLEKALSKKIS